MEVAYVSTLGSTRTANQLVVNAPTNASLAQVPTQINAKAVSLAILEVK
jgi:hypothetical protein